MNLNLFSGDFPFKDILCSVNQLRDDIPADFFFCVRRIDEVKVPAFQQPLKPGNVCIHITVITEHVDVAVLLNRISADQTAVFPVEHGDAAGCMPREMNNLQCSPAQIDQISVKDRQQPSAAMLDIAVKSGFRRVHIEFLKLCVAGNMVSVCMRVQQLKRQIRMQGSDGVKIKTCHSGVDEQGLFPAGQQKDPHALISFRPCIGK